MLRSKKNTPLDTPQQPQAGAAAPAPEAVAPPAPPPPPPGPAEIEALKTQAAEAAQWKDKCLRAVADLDNYRKRMAREKVEHTKFATQHLIARLLPIVDGFELALQHGDQAGDTPAGKALVDGLKMTLSQLHAVLSETGVEVVEAQGKHFDPQVHEAVSQVESEEHPAGQVIQQLRKGYRLQERLLRPATVVVSKGKPAPAAPAGPPAADTQPEAHQPAS